MVKWFAITTQKIYLRGNCKNIVKTQYFRNVTLKKTNAIHQLVKKTQYFLGVRSYFYLRGRGENDAAKDKKS